LQRLIFFLIIVYLIYYLFKRFVSGIFRPRPPKRQKHLPPITDELVKDPVCGTYVPKKEAIVYGRRGKLYYFCSKECLEKFKQQKAKG